MAGSGSESNGCKQVRSFSLPSKSNPINKRIEQELDRLRAKEASSTSPAETISIGLSGLADLYTCINQVLSLPLTQQALSLRQHESCVTELLKGGSNLHGICCSTREIVLQLKKLVTDTRSHLQLQRQCESNVASYICSRKEVIKRGKMVILSLKQLVDDDSFGSSRLFQEDHRLSMVIKALTCISIINISVFESLLFFLSIPVSKPKYSGSLVSKLIHKSRGKTTHQDKSGNELMDVDVALHSLCSGVDAEKVGIAERRLEELMGVIEGIGNSLDRASIQIKETKTCLMNIVSL